MVRTYRGDARVELEKRRGENLRRFVVKLLGELSPFGFDQAQQRFGRARRTQVRAGEDGAMARRWLDVLLDRVRLNPGTRASPDRL
jgi:hypothetical protein